MRQHQTKQTSRINVVAAVAALMIFALCATFAIALVVSDNHTRFNERVAAEEREIAEQSGGWPLGPRPTTRYVSLSDWIVANEAIKQTALLSAQQTNQNDKQD